MDLCTIDVTAVLIQSSYLPVATIQRVKSNHIFFEFVKEIYTVNQSTYLQKYVKRTTDEAVYQSTADTINDHIL